ncbi:MAG TPA: MBL fold metallo-hydrolase [Devosiaceae bacterium]|nr:MBL fold metallo-hydrolase [Devosiaceae bacterium]
MTVTLNFHGAAGTVTGSCYRVVHPNGQFLVDCGMFQGNKTVRALNRNPLPFDPQKIDFVLLTHAHIDHAGLLPKLYHHGYRGPMHMTAPTAGLLEYLLPDAAGIQESDAEHDAKRLRQRGDEPLPPLYTMEDAEEALRHRVTLDYNNWVEPGRGVRARYWNAGHILGSASIEIEVTDADGSKVRLMFSGDIGPDEKVFYNNPEGPAGFDYILCESTYGGRERADYSLESRRESLRAVVNEALARGGNLVIPTFAVERSQELLHDFGLLIKEGEINPSVVFLDSPLASKVTGVYKKYASMFADTELSADELFNDPRFRITESVDDSKAINAIRGGAVIMSASGMADAGRIQHHLRNNLIRASATVLFVGYQAPGTLGQIILSGAREVRIHGELVPVRAQIRTLGTYSAHADHSELMAWIKARLPAHGALFLTHGEDEEREALRRALIATGMAGDQVLLPLLDDAVDLLATGVAGVRRAASPRVDLEQMSSDWNNAYQALLVDLEEALRRAPSDEARLKLMRNVREHLAPTGVLTAPPPTKGVAPGVVREVEGE